MTLGFRIAPVTLAVLLIVTFQPAAQAGVYHWGEAAVQIHLCDQDASAHPFRVTMKHIVTTDALKDVGDLELILQYSFDTATGTEIVPAGETVRARVKVFKADGTRIGLGMMEATVGGAGNAMATKLVDLSLEPGDVVRWRFTFRDFPTMDRLDTLVLIGAMSRPGLDL